MSELQVGLLTKEYPPEVYGGAGVHIAELARALAPLVDVRVHAFGAERDDPLVAASYREWDALAGDAPELAALRTVSADLLIAAGVAGVDLVDRRRRRDLRRDLGAGGQCQLGHVAAVPWG